MNVIVSSVFGGVFSHKVSLSFDDNHLAITNERGVTYLSWGELITPVGFELGLWGYTITFESRQKKYKLIAMSYGCERAYQRVMETLWVKANEVSLDHLLTQIARITQQRYLRQSDVTQFQTLARQMANRWLPWIQHSHTLALVAQKIHWLEQYSHWQPALTQAYQQRYIHKQLQQHSEFFDSVESHPLTLQQRTACIIDDDNNLLLAGAGTGKTSVMIGRAGFLVASRQASYDDILLLAYGRKAADEMNQRMTAKLATDQISAATFHRVGLAIITQVEGVQPSLSRYAEDETAKAQWVEKTLQSLIQEHEHYGRLVLDYLSRYYYVEKDERAFTTLGDYYQYLIDNDIRSFNGENVKSFGELYIANWLLYHGIDYNYDTAYPLSFNTLEHRQYKPNFYLPKYDLYIEYDGIDEQNNPAPYHDKERYLAEIAWKKSIHQGCGTRCVTLTYAHYKCGEILAELARQLSTFNIVHQQLPVNTIVASLKGSGIITGLASLFSQLIGLYKSACLNTDTRQQLIQNATDPKQLTIAFQLLEPIIKAYNAHLKQHNEIDFEDMIVKAIGYVETGVFQSPWRYIMVDEFQDISPPRARLVKALRDNHRGSTVFAVGDDWQAIYRFSGADIRLTTEFKHYFGDTSHSVLDVTFRFNNKIGQVATQFISKNPQQLSKNIRSLTQVTAPAISLLTTSAVERNTKKHASEELANGDIDEVLQAIVTQESQPITVYIVARFWFQLPNKHSISTLNQRYPLLNIQSQTFHAAKGKEADYVIIVGLAQGAHGFPSTKVSSHALDALLPPRETFVNAEERRLFYVALTRAKHRVYLIADMTNASCFVHELIQEHHIELNEFGGDLELAKTKLSNCQCCQVGVLKKRSSSRGVFYACGLFPRCEHTENTCTRCDSVMLGQEYPGFSVCVNSDCKHMIPLCAQCNAHMVLKQGARGDFWGCKNYRVNGINSCKNTRAPSVIQWPLVK